MARLLDFGLHALLRVPCKLGCYCAAFLVAFALVQTAVRHLRFWRCLGKQGQLGQALSEEGRFFSCTNGNHWKSFRAQTRFFQNALAYALLNIFLKLCMYGYAVLYMALSRDTVTYERYIRSSAYRERPAARPAADVVQQEKEIIFIRHGESLWNQGFNRPPWWLVPLRATYLFWLELTLLCERDSAMGDAPLSMLGRNQARGLCQWLEKTYVESRDRMDGRILVVGASAEEGAPPLSTGTTPEAVRRRLYAALLGPCAKIGAGGQPVEGRCVIAASNLRRAVQTACLGLSVMTDAPLVQCDNASCSTVTTADVHLSKTEATSKAEGVSTINKGGKVYVLSALQEATRNIDGHTLMTPQNWMYWLRDDWAACARRWVVDFFSPLSGATQLSSGTLQLDYTFNSGGKALFSSSLLDRLFAFAAWVHSPHSPVAGQDLAVVVGHSIWLRKFLTVFLPPDAGTVEKKEKIANCAVLRFVLVQYLKRDGAVDYWIDPDSILTVFPGYRGVRLAIPL